MSDNVYGDGTINNWFNASAFALAARWAPTATPFATVTTGRAFRTVDLSLVRQFALSSTNKIEARVEAFNAFNWFIPGNPGVNLSSGTTFGKITSFSGAASPRVMQFALRYLF